MPAELANILNGWGTFCPRIYANLLLFTIYRKLQILNIKLNNKNLDYFIRKDLGNIFAPSSSAGEQKCIFFSSAVLTNLEAKWHRLWNKVDKY